MASFSQRTQLESRLATAYSISPQAAKAFDEDFVKLNGSGYGFHKITSGRHCFLQKADAGRPLTRQIKSRMTVDAQCLNERRLSSCKGGANVRLRQR